MHNKYEHTNIQRKKHAGHATRRYQDTPVVDTIGIKDNSNKIPQSNRNCCIVESARTPILAAEARMLLNSSCPKHKKVEIEERMRYLAQKEGPEMPPHTAKALILMTKARMALTHNPSQAFG